MKTHLHAALAAALILTASCKMENPLLTESPLPYGAPQFDKIKTEHYMPAFKEGIARAKAEIDAIVANPDEPDFANTIEALEFSGETLNNVSSIFYNLLEADATPELQAIAEEISPMMTEYSMYVSLNEGLFERIRSVWDRRDSLGLEPDQLRLLDETYKSFARNGANLSPEDKQTYSKYQEELSLLSLKFNNNALASTNAYKLNLTDEELRILADHGGVAGLNLCPAFLSEDDPSTEAEAESRISDMVRHVMHAYRTAGEDVLAIGTDFDGIGGRLEIPSPDRMHLLRDALAAAGMKQSVLDKMWDGNAERVLLAAEEVFR